MEQGQSPLEAPHTEAQQEPQEPPPVDVDVHPESGMYIFIYTISFCVCMICPKSIYICIYFLDIAETTAKESLEDSDKDTDSSVISKKKIRGIKTSFFHKNKKGKNGAQAIL